MLRTNTALWRIAFLSGLGILPSACGANAEDAEDAQGAQGANTLGNPRVHETASRTQLPAEGSTCVDSVPVLLLGVPSGLERCADGRVHRPAAAQCSSKLPRAAATERPPLDASNACELDSECTDQPLGHCDARPSEGGSPAYGKVCLYGCVTDANCGAGSFCQCGDPVGTCVGASCRSDADCGSGLLCSAGVGEHTLGCPATSGFYCETPSDGCRSDQDCPATPYGSYCATNTDGERACASFPGGSCGRPFLVDGRARLAPLEHSGAWLLGGTAARRQEQLSDEQREALAAAWAQLGLMEHASVAAFARFTLQLLSVGAPVELVEQGQRALADELLHTRLCFGLASEYAGEALGPGPLPTEHALDSSSLEEIAALTLHEACVGETLAALEASEALALALDPAVRAVLARIEADERRHAELGWRFVTWAVRVGGESVQRRIQRELLGLAHSSGFAQPAPSAALRERSALDLTAHGILPEAKRAELRAAALSDVVLPCARALLPSERSSTPARLRLTGT